MTTPTPKHPRNGPEMTRQRILTPRGAVLILPGHQNAEVSASPDKETASWRPVATRPDPSQHTSPRRPPRSAILEIGSATGTMAPRSL